MKSSREETPPASNFLSAAELSRLRFRSLGKGVLIDRAARLYGAERISVGDNVRIDCFSLLSAGVDGIYIGSHIHISSGVSLYGGGAKVELRDFCGLSPGVKLFTASDDFVEGYLRGPMVPMNCRKLQCGSVIIGKNSQVGAGSVILPQVEIGFNVSVGALSLVNRVVADNVVVAGIPIKEVSQRDGDIAERLMSEFERKWELELKEQAT